MGLGSWRRGWGLGMHKQEKRECWPVLGKGTCQTLEMFLGTRYLVPKTVPYLWDYIFSVVQVLLNKIFFWYRVPGTGKGRGNIVWFKSTPYLRIWDRVGYWV